MVGLPIAKKLLMIFFSRAIKQPQRLTPHAEERPIELPNSEKVHARHSPHLLFLPFPVLYFSFTCSESAPHCFEPFLFYVHCLSGSAKSRLHTYWSRKICDGLPSLGSIMSRCLLLFSIDPSRLTPEQCPLIPWTFRLENPARLTTTCVRVLHFLNMSKLLHLFQVKAQHLKYYNNY